MSAPATKSGRALARWRYRETTRKRPLAALRKELESVSVRLRHYEGARREDVEIVCSVLGLVSGLLTTRRKLEGEELRSLELARDALFDLRGSARRFPMRMTRAFTVDGEGMCELRRLIGERVAATVAYDAEQLEEKAEAGRDNVVDLSAARARRCKGGQL